MIPVLSPEVDPMSPATVIAVGFTLVLVLRDPSVLDDTSAARSRAARRVEPGRVDTLPASAD